MYFNFQKLSTFITTPFVNFRKATELLNKHGNNEYHLLSAEKSSAFIDNYKSSKSVKTILNKKSMAIIDKNKKRLVPIIKSIIFCGHNNLPLRGHRDDGQLEINSAINGDQGVFRSLLAFRLDSGDEILREHLENCTKNATMISKTVQNEIIEVIHEVLVNNIVTNVKKSKYFSILCDETTDISTKEQITFSVR